MNEHFNLLNSQAREVYATTPAVQSIYASPDDYVTDLTMMMMGESSGKPNAKSSAGAFGLFQLMPDTAKELGVDPKIPAQNIAGGIEYYNRMLTEFGDKDAAMLGYNLGPGTKGGDKGAYGHMKRNPNNWRTANYVLDKHGTDDKSKWTRGNYLKHVGKHRDAAAQLVSGVQPGSGSPLAGTPPPNTMRADNLPSDMGLVDQSIAGVGLGKEVFGDNSGGGGGGMTIEHSMPTERTVASQMPSAEMAGGLENMSPDQIGIGTEAMMNPFSQGAAPGLMDSFKGAAMDFVKSPGSMMMAAGLLLSAFSDEKGKERKANRTVASASQTGSGPGVAQSNPFIQAQQGSPAAGSILPGGFRIQ